MEYERFEFAALDPRGLQFFNSALAVGSTDINGGLELAAEPDARRMAPDSGHPRTFLQCEK